MQETKGRKKRKKSGREGERGRERGEKEKSRGKKDAVHDEFFWLRKDWSVRPGAAGTSDGRMWTLSA